MDGADTEALFARLRGVADIIVKHLCKIFLRRGASRIATNEDDHDASGSA